MLTSNTADAECNVQWTFEATDSTTGADYDAYTVAKEGSDSLKFYTSTTLSIDLKIIFSNNNPTNASGNTIVEKTATIAIINCSDSTQAGIDLYYTFNIHFLETNARSTCSIYYEYGHEDT